MYLFLAPKLTRYTCFWQKPNKNADTVASSVAFQKGRASCATAVCAVAATEERARELEKRCGTDMMQQQQQQHQQQQQRLSKILELWGLPLSCEARRGGMQSREKKPDCATFDAESTPHGARPGPTRAELVYGRGSCVPRSRTQEKKVFGR